MSKWRTKLSYLNFLQLGEAYDYGVEAQAEIDKAIPRSPIFPADAGILAQVIFDARHSDHVEIGTFYGGSAILAALVKKKFYNHGHIYCVDPLEFRPTRINDVVTNSMATTKDVMENAAKFGVEDMITIIPEMSFPWPLEGKTFGTGYIDGDHWNDMPMKDWTSLKSCVSYAVVFDDYVRGKPEVTSAALAAANDPEWLMIYVGGTSAVVRRRE